MSSLSLDCTTAQVLQALCVVKHKNRGTKTNFKLHKVISFCVNNGFCVNSGFVSATVFVTRLFLNLQLKFVFVSGVTKGNSIAIWALCLVLCHSY